MLLLQRRNMLKLRKLLQLQLWCQLIVVPVAVSMPSAVLGNGSDSKYVETPLYTPHLFLDCMAGGLSASSEVPIHVFNCNLFQPGVDFLTMQSHCGPPPLCPSSTGQ